MIVSINHMSKLRFVFITYFEIGGKNAKMRKRMVRTAGLFFKGFSLCWNYGVILSLFGGFDFGWWKCKIIFAEWMRGVVVFLHKLSFRGMCSL